MQEKHAWIQKCRPHWACSPVFTTHWLTPFRGLSTILCLKRELNNKLLLYEWVLWAKPSFRFLLFKIYNSINYTAGRGLAVNYFTHLLDGQTEAKWLAQDIGPKFRPPGCQLSALSWLSHTAPSSRPSTQNSKASFLPSGATLTHQEFVKIFKSPICSYLLTFKKLWLGGKPQWMLQPLLTYPCTKHAHALGQMYILLKLAVGHNTDQGDSITVRLQCKKTW